MSVVLERHDEGRLRVGNEFLEKFPTFPSRDFSAVLNRPCPGTDMRLDLARAVTLTGTTGKSGRSSRWVGKVEAKGDRHD